MRWVEIAGAPGVGKSTLVDEFWPPRCIAWRRKDYPKEWNDFLEVTNRLMRKIVSRKSPVPGDSKITGTKANCERLNYQAFQKIAEVSRMKDDRIFIQVGLVQRGLGIGYLLEDPEEIAEYFKVMPVSLGVILLHAPIEIVQRRNVERHKDRAWMVPLMERSRQIAAEVLKDRIPLLELDTTRPIHENKTAMLAFAHSAARLADTRAA